MHDVSNMTEVSQNAFRLATVGRLSLKKAIELLKSNAHTRTTKDILMRFTGLDPTEEGKLQEYVCRKLAETSSELSYDSLRKKVSIWVKNSGPISKASAIQLAFALELDFDRADELLKFTCSEGFHLRDPEDIIFSYAIANRLSYEKALALRERADSQGLLKPPKSPKDSTSNTLTNQIVGKVRSISSEAELFDLLKEERPNFGTLHNTAYSLFIKYLDVLQTPSVDDDLVGVIRSEIGDCKNGSDDPLNEICDPNCYSIRDVLTVYLHNSKIPRDERPRDEKKKDKKSALILSAMQKNIRAYWPDEITLSKMKNRLADVTRKVMILLFMAVDGYEDYGYDSQDDDEYSDVIVEMSREEQFEDTYQRLEHMLNVCGFAPMDPRVPFDWMMLFCLCAGEKELLDARIERFLEVVFADVAAE